MVVIRRRVVVESRIIDMRRAGIKVRVYENARVYLKGTAGRGERHWAADDFTECINSPHEVMYFSGDSELPAVAIHGDHVHVLRPNRGRKLVPLSTEYAEKLLSVFVEKLRERGVKIRVENYEDK
ncbi:MAG: hypothetical protein DRJ60_00920 [Thermoprotei archaeon]|nr:MAG: hypothetical protein DRJ60_00920 [Thermoprotei archaeon]